MRRAGPCLVWIGACVACAMGSSCAEIGLRRAMTTQVQPRTRSLFEALELGSNFQARDQAVALRKALESPEVARDAPYAKDPAYQQLLREAVDATQQVGAVARRFDREALGKLQAEISSRCDACHRKFRAP